MVGELDFLQAVDQVKEMNSARALFYRTLAALYYKELPQEKIIELSQVDWASIPCENAQMEEGYSLIAQAVRKPDSGTRQKLACDYAYTFLAAGTYEERRAIPYESVFTSKEGLMMQDARDDVYRLFCNEHMGVGSQLHEPEDHLSFEFEFMAHLAERCNEALDSANYTEAARLARVAQEFHDTHIASWIDDFCDAADKWAKTRFYQGVSKLTRGYAQEDNEALADIVAVLNELETLRVA